MPLAWVLLVTGFGIARTRYVNTHTLCLLLSTTPRGFVTSNACVDLPRHLFATCTEAGPRKRAVSECALDALSLSSPSSRGEPGRYSFECAVAAPDSSQHAGESMPLLPLPLSLDAGTCCRARVLLVCAWQLDLGMSVHRITVPVVSFAQAPLGPRRARRVALEQQRQRTCSCAYGRVRSRRPKYSVAEAVEQVRRSCASQCLLSAQHFLTSIPFGSASQRLERRVGDVAGHAKPR